MIPTLKNGGNFFAKNKASIIASLLSIGMICPPIQKDKRRSK